jgi:hypothetical protein
MHDARLVGLTRTAGRNSRQVEIVAEHPNRLRFPHRVEPDPRPPLLHTPFVAGGGDTDDLSLERWPAGALRFHLAQGELFVEVTTGTATRNGDPLETDSLVALGVGDVLGYRDDSFEIAGGEPAHTTVTGDLEAQRRR